MENKVIVRFDWRRRKLSFNGEQNLQSVISSMDNIYYNTTDENENELPQEAWTLVEDTGHVLLVGKDNIEAEVGILDSDGEFATTYCKYIEDCTDRELDLIRKELEGGAMILSDELKDYMTEMGE